MRSSSTELETFPIAAARDQRGQRDRAAAGQRRVDRLRRARRRRSRAAQLRRRRDGQVRPGRRARASSSSSARPRRRCRTSTRRRRRSDALMPGPEIQAAAIATALAGFPLRDRRRLVNWLLVIVLAAVAPLVALRLGILAVRGDRRWPRSPALLVGAQLLFNAGTIVYVVYAVRRRRRSRSCHGGDPRPDRGVRARAGARRVRALRARGGRRPGAGRRRRRAPRRRAAARATVMFSDLRGFTSFSETLEPEQVIESLNMYLTEMSEAILDHGGTLVAYMGDGIMAVFGAPLKQDDHADRALEAARDMLAGWRSSTAGCARRASTRRLQDGHRAQQRAGDVRQRRLRATARVHGARRHDEHRGAAGGHDQGHAAPALHRRHDAS